MPSDPISEELKLDHFKVYKQYNPNTGGSVKLQSQFDVKGGSGGPPLAPVQATISQMDYFSTAVSKSNSKLLNKNAHLAFYQLLQRSQDPQRVVVLKNQFGLQKLILGQPRFLAVPSQKVEPGLTFPKRLDHFKVYNVLYGEPIVRKVSLADQFDKQAAVSVERPEWFAVPCTKVDKNGTTKIGNPKAHLTFYSVTPKVYKIEKESKDQFGDHKLLIGTSVTIGVPTIKLVWEVYD